jgi:hypothetical protein
VSLVLVVCECRSACRERISNIPAQLSANATAIDVSPAVQVEARYRRGSELVTCSLDRLSVDAVLAAGPAREFRWFRGRRHYSGWYFSSTVGGLVAYESRLELARIQLADFDPDVVGIAAQPFQLTGREGTVRRRHVPDLLLRRSDGAVVVVDVKPADRVDDPVVRAVFDWTARVVGWRGWRFEVWSGADPVLLANVSFLAGYRRPQVIEQSLVETVLEAAARQGTIGGAERAVGAPVARVRPVILHLLWTGRLRTDLGTPLGPASVLQVGGP